VPKFRHGGEVVEACQFHYGYDDFPGVEKVVDTSTNYPSVSYRVRTPEGRYVELAGGEWLVADPDGRGYDPVAPEVFAAEYEPVVEE
jgi:hypothetical protein